MRGIDKQIEYPCRVGYNRSEDTSTMNTLIIALNSKYNHSALAPWYLKAACGPECGKVNVLEHTINENIDTILTSIYLKKPDVAAFSCYIWNIPYALKLAASLKKLLPETVVVLGGPEVSYDAGDVLKEYSFIDFVLAGEGETSFPKLIGHIAASGANKPDRSMDTVGSMGTQHFNTSGVERIDGIAYRTQGGIHAKAPTLVENLDSIASPYTDEMILSLKNKIVYFETSRGCPFSCSYCLSSVSEGTRHFSMERVLADLDRLVSAGVRQIKFVDRTFNAHKKRAMTIVQHIIELDRLAVKGMGSKRAEDEGIGMDKAGPGDETGVRDKTGGGLHCNFHFEVGADLFDEEMLQLLENAPKGLFQLEAGVQTANVEALLAINRKTNLKKLFENLIRLKKSGNIHLHTDLIAGLPYEDYNSFGSSFNKLYATGPHQLQLGILKFLKGTRLRSCAVNEGYQYNHFPPYEVLSGKCISYDELIVLKGVAELVERFYNSSRFTYSLEYVILHSFSSPFQFFESFYYFHKKNGYMEMHSAVRELYAIFYSFTSTFMNDVDNTALRELLRLDFLASDSTGTLPDFLEKRSYPGFNDNCFDYLRNTDHISLIMPEAKGMSPKQLFKKVRFEQFYLDFDPMVREGDISVRYNPMNHTVLIFNYLSKDKVSGRYLYYKADILKL